MRARLEIRLVGTVQGVGFRPFVHRLAREERLDGWVRNDGDGVTVEAEGEHAALLRLLERVHRETPPAALIYASEHRFLDPVGHAGFEIRESAAAGPPKVWVLPDLATCAACRAEIADPSDRRHRYPFTNCTHCGPRFTIIEGLPYDRPRTSMRTFTMCAACAAEYADPSDRRFHAQPVACPACGPRLAWRAASGDPATGDAALRAAVRAIDDGGIVALKGLGGYHLVVDAGDDAAVAELRRRKRRSHKAFAVMYPDLASLAADVDVPPFAEPLLTGSQAPILLLPRTADSAARIAPAVAPDSPYLGVFLPYTPLHHVLLADLGRPVVATSGNLSDEPIQHDDREAAAELGPIADGFLVHDRPIVRPADDSVLHVVTRPRARPQMLRRARGYAPLPLLAPRELPPILAVGGQMNVTLAFSRGREVVLSQHLGDMEGYEAREAYRATLRDLLGLYGVEPRLVAHDLHPDYFTTALAEELGLPRVAVQHHHAHLAACMLENALEGETLGLTWDGTGYGPDRTVWGGECLLGDAGAYRRVATLTPFRLPGGEKAVEETWRVAVALLHAAYGDAFPRDLPGLAAIDPRTLEPVAALAGSGLGSPSTTSVGRLYDGLSALLGLSLVNTHQAQSAQMLEYAAWRHGPAAEPLPLPVLDGDPLRLDVAATVRAAVERVRRGDAVEAIAASFHHALAGAAVEVARRVGVAQVAMAGGVFCNRYLTELLLERLEAERFRPHVHGLLPPTDGSLAAGQLWVAASSAAASRL